MKIHIELDLENPADEEALDRLLGRNEILAIDPLVSGAQMGKAAADLGKVIGDQPKLSPSQKGRVAAETRWKGKKKPKKHSVPPVPARRDHEPDTSKSHEVDSNTYPRSEGGGAFDFPTSPWIDGREILEGTYAVPPEPPKQESSDERPKPVDDVIEP